VGFDREELNRSMTALYGSALQLEMSMRASQTLELTDAPYGWDPMSLDRPV